MACNILVVDDDPAIRDVLVQVLEDEGHHAVSAANGREALQHLENTHEHTCLILLDLMMPDMSGTDFVVSQRRNSQLANIPVVIVSADHRVSDAARSLAVDGFVQKPIDLNWLIETVERHCPIAPHEAATARA